MYKYYYSLGGKRVIYRLGEHSLDIGSNFGIKHAFTPACPSFFRETLDMHEELTEQQAMEQFPELFNRTMPSA